MTAPAPPSPLDAAVVAIRRGRRTGVVSPWAVLVAVGVVAAQLPVQLLPVAPLARLWVAAAVVTGLTLVVARRAAASAGGWARGLGLGPPRWRDVLLALGIALVTAPLQVVAVVLYTAATPWDDAVADNVGDLAALGPWSLASVLVVVVVAPVTEELLFRGVVLRGLMTRMGFWPAATAASALFGLVHVPGAVSGAASVVVGNAVLGLVLCVVARRTGRLAPGMLVHAVRNAATVLVVLSLG